jgi:predicted enzyme related to lactoylglutathione lyase
MSHLVKNRVRGIFVPVRDVAKARDWYLGLLGLPRDDKSLDGEHLYVIPMDDPRIILDEMPEWDRDHPAGPPTHQTPAIMLDTDDVHAGHAYVRDYGADVVTDVTELETVSWFVFRDLDGNHLMVCGDNPQNGDSTK